MLGAVYELTSGRVRFLDPPPDQQSKEFLNRKVSLMKNSRRQFMQGAAASGLAVAATSVMAQDPANSKGVVVRADVEKRTGPFGEGLPITIAGYDYSRVRAIVEGKVTVEGCSHQFEVSGIGPMNNHAFFGPQSRDVTELGLIPYILAYSTDDFRE